MCLLIVSYKTFPDRDLLQAGEKGNPDGAGIAWIDNGKVKWKKGLRARDLEEIGLTTNPPWLIHFRKATVGKNIPQLTHPFVFDLSASTELEGETEAGVLAHNGNWLFWHEKIMDLVNENPEKHSFPIGHWSDSRALAFYGAIKGSWTALENLSSGDKIAVMLPEGIKRIGSWGLVDEKLGLCCSYNPYSNYNVSYTNYGTRIVDEDYYNMGYRWRPSVVKNHTPVTLKEYRDFNDYYESVILTNNKAETAYKDEKGITEKTEEAPSPKG